MRLSRRASTVVLALCLLILQAQVVASALLGCAHGRAVAGVVASAHCQAPGTGAADQGHSKRLLDCQRCALHCALGVPALALAPPLLPDLGGHPFRPAATEPHLQGLTPESLDRPPIS